MQVFFSSIRLPVSGVTRGSCARGQELNFAPGDKFPNFRQKFPDDLFFLLFHFIFKFIFLQTSFHHFAPPVLLPDKKHVFLVFISHIFLQFLYFSYKKIVRNPNFAPPVLRPGRPPSDPPRYATALMSDNA